MSATHRLQAKDIDEIALLRYIRDNGPCLAFSGFGRYVGDGASGFPEKVVLAKLKSMIRRDLIDGCACGCRGDFEITERGENLVGETPQWQE